MSGGTPVIAPPSAGDGDVRGPGEKLSVNLSTGAATLKVPIVVSPGRSGFTPELTLVYDSGAGNGPFGVGWRLSLPAITRKSVNGLPRYQDAAATDVFLDSGAGDLVPVSVEKVPGVWSGAEHDREGWRIRRFRPRKEGLLARVERWTRLADGDTHWRTISHDNVLSVYGFDAASRIADEEDPGRVFGWLVCESYDAFGNAIRFEYAAEDDANVDLSLGSERSRARGANRYPKRILYGNRVPLLLDPGLPGFRPPHTVRPDFDAAGWMFEVVFDYGEGHRRPRPPDAEGRVFVEAASAVPAGRSWSARLDPFSGYRAAFEVRTHRLCRGALLFHRFPEEPGMADCLVRATLLEYEETPTMSFLHRVTQAGYRRGSDGGYLERCAPGLEFGYSASPLHDPAFDGRRLEVRDVEGPEHSGAGTGGDVWEWVDLDAEGLPGALSLQADAWHYKRNLGGGRLGSMEPLPAKPSHGPRGIGGAGAAVATHVRLADLAGAGMPGLVDLSTPGYYGRTRDAGWSAFRAFPSWPNICRDDRDVRMVDLTGDGRADILVTGQDALTFYPSLEEGGFGAGIRIPLPSTEGGGREPKAVFSDESQSLFLADMSGDGLADLVRIRNGGVAYWPNLGFGRFGPKVDMEGAPWFDRPEAFDPRRLRLGDLDGSGTTDIVYLGREGVRLYLNQSGNAWSTARRLEAIPAAADHAAVALVDLLGRGTACVCWSSRRAGAGREPLSYVDLMEGRKPHLLTEVRNLRGVETAVRYVASTEFLLKDRAAGRPWLTRLPFPVQVVDRLESYDAVGRTRFVSRYTYHHGSFDPDDRLFRFGRVDQIDTEELPELLRGSRFPVGDNVEARSHVPPLLTRLWFHPGVDAAHADGRASRAFAPEYSGDPWLEDAPLPAELDAEETRAACRALAGSLLRREVYALDGTTAADRPCLVEERNQALRRLQPRAGRAPAVFLLHPRETVVVEHRRDLAGAAGEGSDDPRVVHGLTLAADDFGIPILTASAAYGRRRADPDPVLTDADRREQQRTRIVFTTTAVTDCVDLPDAHRAPVAHDTRVFELHDPPTRPARSTARLLRPDELAGLIAAASDGAHDLPYQDADGAGVAADLAVPFRRLIDHVRVRFRRDDLSAALPQGGLESLALPFETRRLALTRTLVDELFLDSGRMDAGDLRAALETAGYVREADHDGWWIVSSRVGFSPDPRDDPFRELEHARRHFFLPCRDRDPFGNVTTVTYDPYDLLPVEVCDPVGNRVTAGERDDAGRMLRPGNDYRVLKPALVMDANRNRTAAAYDALGLVAGTAVLGQPESPSGDNLAGFEADLSDARVATYLADPHAASRLLLSEATRRVIVDLSAYARTRSEGRPRPLAVCLLARATHAADLERGALSPIRLSFSYRDGFGREIQKKDPAPPGPLEPGGPVVAPRWVGSGWTLFDNKGTAVRRHEPFFDSTHAFRFGCERGVGTTTFYDPLGRLVGALHPNHSWEKVRIDPWRHECWDVNDTVLVPDPSEDPDLGGHFRRLPADTYRPTWYAGRISGALGTVEQDAAAKTALHAATPVANFLDSLGRVFLTVTHCRNGGSDSAGKPASEERLRTRIVYDVEGNQRRVLDPLGRTVARYDYDMAGNRLHSATMDAGERWLLPDVGGREMRAWDDRGHAFLTAYDAAGRPTIRVVRGTDPERSDPRTLGRDVVYEKIEYGEGEPAAASRNLRTRPARIFHGSGIRTIERYDGEGHVLASTDAFTEDHKALPDWARSPALQPRTYQCRSAYDALNRLTTHTAPDGSVLRITHDEGDRATALDVHLRGASAATRLLTGITCDARGQRTRIAYGNGVMTALEYDPCTFRLKRLRTTRPAPTIPGAKSLFLAPGTVQDLRITSDPIGNVTAVRDDALTTVVTGNEAAPAAWDYRYDGLYRLIEATGREHGGQSEWNRSLHGDLRDHPWTGASRPGDPQALRAYAERYTYDAAGNILRLAHRSAGGSWRRDYSYEEPSLLEPGRAGNRLSATAVDDPEPYAYDAHGNMTRMPHLPMLRWNFKDRLAAAARQVAASPEVTFFGYATGDRRARKVIERANGTRKSERIDLDGWEVAREYAADGVTLSTEQETLSITDGSQRIAIVEARTVACGIAVPAPEPAIRYQLANHLGSVSLELDAAAALLSYEEYTPYGNPALQAGPSMVEVRRKRHRYTGCERDDETGLAHHGARTYAPWLGRWTSCDPSGLLAGRNATYQVACKHSDADSRRPPFDPRVSRFRPRDPVVFAAAARRRGGAQARRTVEWPQNWNLYVYANDSPTVLVDRNGRFSWRDAIGALIGVGVMAGLLIATLYFLPSAQARWTYLGITVAPAVALTLTALTIYGLEKKDVIRVPSGDRYTSFDEGRVFDFWALGHYFLPALVGGLIAAILGTQAPGLSPEDVLAISGFSTMSLALGWELIERPLIHADEYRTNIVGDVVIGSIGGVAATYGVMAALGRPIDTGAVVGFGVFIPAYGGLLTQAFLDSGVIHPTRDERFPTP